MDSWMHDREFRQRSQRIMQAGNESEKRMCLMKLVYLKKMNIKSIIFDKDINYVTNFYNLMP